MSTDIHAIVDLSRSIASLAKHFDNGTVPEKEYQDELVWMAEQLAIAARGPDENMYYLAGQLSHNAAIRSIVSMGVLDVIPEDGSAISVNDVAAQLNVNTELVGRFLRACASTHFFTSPAVNHYAHNALSRAFMSPDNRALFAQMYDFTGEGVLAIPRFGESVHWKTAGDYYKGPFQLALGTDLGYWEYLAAHPGRMSSFNTGMRLGKIGCLTSAFPFGVALACDPCAENGVAIVDVGGGRGQSLEAIRKDWPEIKGRFVLQDLPDVIQDTKTKGIPAGIEPMPSSFFNEQPVKGARIYYFRRIFHCWSQAKSQQILENTRQAMDDYSRLLIADMVLPDTDCPRDLAMQDLNMMSLGGTERSTSEWRQLLESAGLVLQKIWLNEDGPKHAVVEAVLPGFKGHSL
ncbi:uncharacterized protein ATNIH1004_003972 [Aspergillus tanneri]|nr:uncharacterized protein ATNIH1004_003972 [Aspergillus tanneri]KAA8648089.1 hypothetical protein ATNIH1004_003972 [Aspergillus tanneri]